MARLTVPEFISVRWQVCPSDTRPWANCHCRRQNRWMFWSLSIIDGVGWLLLYVRYVMPVCNNNNNNNNNAMKDNFMVLSSCSKHCESSPWFTRWMQHGLNHKPACRLPVNYTHHRHFIITQPESWYSFYHPTEGRRLSRPGWLATYRDGLPPRTWSPIQVLTGPSVQ